jgi:hypothetical protein
MSRSDKCKTVGEWANSSLSARYGSAAVVVKSIRDEPEAASRQTILNVSLQITLIAKPLTEVLRFSVVHVVQFDLAELPIPK